MCENDALAFGAIDYVRSALKLRIPADIAIAGFDNTPLAASPAYDLTTYEQPANEMVAAILSMILGREPRESKAFRGKTCRSINRLIIGKSGASDATTRKEQVKSSCFKTGWGLRCPSEDN